MPRINIFSKIYSIFRLNKVINFVYKVFLFLKDEIFLLYRFNIVLAIAVFFVLSYFLILVQIKPFSSPYIKSIIVSAVKEEIDNRVTIDDILISFTKTGLVRLDVVNINSNDLINIGEGASVDVPAVSFAIPIYKMLFLDFTPSVLFVEDANLVVNSFDDLPVLNHSGLASSSDENSSESTISSLLKSIRKIRLYDVSVKLLNKNKGDVLFLVEDARFNIKNSSRIRVVADINSKFKTASQEFKDFSINTHCDLVSSNLNGNCRLFLSNIDLNILSKFLSKESFLDNIKSDSSFGLVYNKDGKEQELLIDSESRYFKLSSKDLFSQGLHLKDLKFDLSYDFAQDLLKIDSLDSNIDFPKKDNEPVNIDKSFLKLNLEVLGVNQFKSSKVNLQLANIDGSKIKDLWPLFLARQDIRDWFSKHFSAGKLSSGNLDMKIVRNQETGKDDIEYLNSKLDIKGMFLNYSKRFPIIKNMDFTLNFDKNSMLANIHSGKALDSYIDGSKVKIADFQNSFLEIDLTMKGDAIDVFRHINYRAKGLNNAFKSVFEGGIAKTKGKISFSLAKKSLGLSDFYVKINSDIENVENKSFAGNLKLAVEKKYDSYDFVSNINLNEIFTHKKNSLNIKKLHSDKSNLSFIVIPKGNLVKISGLKLNMDGKDIIKSSIIYDSNSEKLKKIYLKNSGFGNDYVLDYDYNGSMTNISFNGDNLVIVPSQILSVEELKPRGSSPIGFFNNLYLSNFEIKVDIKNVVNNDLRSKDVNLQLKCESYICRRGILLSKYIKDGKEAMLTDFVVSRNDMNLYKIAGNVSDVGYFAQLYDISKSVKKGALHFNINQSVDAKNNGEVLYDGEISLDKDVTIYDNPSIKKLERDTMFSTVKDKIFSNEKTTFSRAEVEFSINPKLSMINVKSLIANNLKIGITSKGYYDYASGNAKFKGKVIPGYLINNLFGIGNIPVVGDVVSGVLTGGKNNGIFGLNYEYRVLSYGKDPEFETFTAKSFVPSSIQSLFED